MAKMTAKNMVAALKVPSVLMAANVLGRLNRKQMIAVMALKITVHKAPSLRVFRSFAP